MYALAPMVVIADDDRGSIMLDERSGRYWMLNDTAAVVLHCLLDGGTPQDAAGQLRSRYPGAPDPTVDVQALLTQLCDRGLLVASSREGKRR